jgi:chemotaxis protein methyltransferase CheR
MDTLNAETAAIEYIIDLVYQRSRVRLHQGKEALIRARLGKRLRHFGFSTLSQYCQYLRTDANVDELVRVIDALTTNFTNFFREADHFQFLVGAALPELLAHRRKPFHLWSAACATGEEAYTIAFYLAEHYSPASGWDWQVTASDISTKALQEARLGIYAEDRIGTVPTEWLRKYFQKGAGKWLGHYRVKPEIAERITFQQINLVGQYSLARPCEVIFCRNVMIYFDRPTQEQLISRLCRFLAPKGFLLIGHSESLNGLNLPLRCLRPSIYQYNA